MMVHFIVHYSIAIQQAIHQKGVCVIVLARIVVEVDANRRERKIVRIQIEAVHLVIDQEKGMDDG